MNRLHLQSLSQARAAEAQALLDAGLWSGAYYLAGYAVECAFNACIAKLTKEHDFPDKENVLKSYSHRLAALAEVAKVDQALKADVTANSALFVNWDIAIVFGSPIALGRFHPFSPPIDAHVLMMA